MTEESAVFNQLPTWQRMQYRSFRAWVNHHLSTQKLQFQLIETQLDDGYLLSQLLEVLSSGHITGIRRPNASGPAGSLNSASTLSRIQKINNLYQCFQFLKAQKVNLDDTLQAENIADCDLKLTLGLIWHLILHYQFQHGRGAPHSTNTAATQQQPSQSKTNVKSALLERLKRYLGIELTQLQTPIELNSFTQKEFQSGIIFVLMVIRFNRPRYLPLFYSFLVESFQIHNISLSQLESNFSLIFYIFQNDQNYVKILTFILNLIETEFNIPKALDPYELASISVPDEKSIMTFVSMCLDYFEANHGAPRSGGAELSGKHAPVEGGAGNDSGLVFKIIIESFKGLDPNYTYRFVIRDLRSYVGGAAERQGFIEGELANAVYAFFYGETLAYYRSNPKTRFVIALYRSPRGNRGSDRNDEGEVEIKIDEVLPQGVGENNRREIRKRFGQGNIEIKLSFILVPKNDIHLGQNNVNLLNLNNNQRYGIFIISSFILKNNQNNNNNNFIIIAIYSNKKQIKEGEIKINVNNNNGNNNGNSNIQFVYFGFALDNNNNANNGSFEINFGNERNKNQFGTLNLNQINNNLKNNNSNNSDSSDDEIEFENDNVKLRYRLIFLEYNPPSFSDHLTPSSNSNDGAATIQARGANVPQIAVVQHHDTYDGQEADEIEVRPSEVNYNEVEQQLNSMLSQINNNNNNNNRNNNYNDSNNMQLPPHMPADTDPVNMQLSELLTDLNSNRDQHPNHRNAHLGIDSGSNQDKHGNNSSNDGPASGASSSGLPSPGISATPANSPAYASNKPRDSESQNNDNDEDPVEKELAKLNNKVSKLQSKEQPNRLHLHPSSSSNKSPLQNISHTPQNTPVKETKSAKAISASQPSYKAQTASTPVGASSYGGSYGAATVGDDNNNSGPVSANREEVIDPYVNTADNARPVEVDIDKELAKLNSRADNRLNNPTSNKSSNPTKSGAAAANPSSYGGGNKSGGTEQNPSSYGSGAAPANPSGYGSGYKSGGTGANPSSYGGGNKSGGVAQNPSSYGSGGKASNPSNYGGRGTAENPSGYGSNPSSYEIETNPSGYGSSDKGGMASNPSGYGSGDKGGVAANPSGYGSGNKGGMASNPSGYGGGIAQNPSNYGSGGKAANPSSYGGGNKSGGTAANPPSYGSNYSGASRNPSSQDNNNNNNNANQNPNVRREKGEVEREMDSILKGLNTKLDSKKVDNPNSELSKLDYQLNDLNGGAGNDPDAKNNYEYVLVLIREFPEDRNYCDELISQFKNMLSNNNNGGGKTEKDLENDKVEGDIKALILNFNEITNIFDNSLNSERSNFNERDFKNKIKNVLNIIFNFIILIDYILSQNDNDSGDDRDINEIKNQGKKLKLVFEKWTNIFLNTILLSILVSLKKYNIYLANKNNQNNLFEVKNIIKNFEISITLFRNHFSILILLIQNFITLITLYSNYSISYQTEVIICSKCGLRCAGQYIKVDKQLNYHPKCFSCSKCSKMLAGKYYKTGGSVFCGECIKGESGGGGGTSDGADEKCGNCGKVIEGQYVKAIGKAWHYECLVCGECKKQLGTGEKMYVNDGWPLCQSCADK